MQVTLNKSTKNIDVKKKNILLTYNFNLKVVQLIQSLYQSSLSSHLYNQIVSTLAESLQHLQKQMCGLHQISEK